MSHAEKIQANCSCGINVDNNIVKVELSTGDSFIQTVSVIFAQKVKEKGNVFRSK